MYLNYVEVLNELDSGNFDILIYFNKIRERVGVRIYIIGVLDVLNIYVDND